MKLNLRKVKCALTRHKWIKYPNWEERGKWWAECLVCGEKKEVTLSWSGDK